MNVCTYVFDIDGVLIIDEKLPFKGPLASEIKSKGIELLEERAKKGKVIVITGRKLSEKRAVLAELAERGLNLKIVHQFIFREEEIGVKEWKLNVLKNIAEKSKICEIHEDDEMLLSMLKKNPQFRETALYLYRGSHIELF